MKDEKIDAKYLSSIAKGYVNEILAKKNYYAELDDEILIDLLLVSYIGCNNSF